MNRLLNAYFLILLMAAVSLTGCGVGRGPVTVTSPDGSITVTFNSVSGDNGDAVMNYSISRNGIAVIEQSGLGIIRETGGFIGDDMEIAGIEESSVKEEYTNTFGKQKDIPNSYNELIVSLREESAPNAGMDMIFRVFDDGAAFRYYLPAGDDEEMSITGESSEFNLPGNPRAFVLPLNSFTSNYETNYEIMPLSELSPDALIGLPLLIEHPDGLWIALTEADLTDYAGMYLTPKHAGDAVLVSTLPPLPENPEVRAVLELPFVTPWRVIMIANDPGKLIESNIIMNLNDPCALEDISWIKPGKAAWDWWSGQVVKNVRFKGGMNTETMRYYADFAADAGLQYLLIDAGWYGNHRGPDADITKTIPEIDMPAIIKHANGKGVDIALWVNWRCVERQMDEAFPLYESWGVRGVKIDYMDRDDQEMVDFYHRVVKKAAEHHLLVDFHGAYKPTGIRRTYPNLITREGVLGQEYNKWSDRCQPEHNVTIPFTRMLAGPMDYTPGAFSNATLETFEARRIEPMSQGTRCHQLAMFVVYESPFQMLADHPANYREQDGFEFLKAVPVVWDETKVINAKPGDYITIARRQEDTWFVGSMTDWDSRELAIPLAFLGGGNWDADIYADAPDAGEKPEKLTNKKYLVSADTIIRASLAPGGGHTVILRKSSGSSPYPPYDEN